MGMLRKGLSALALACVAACASLGAPEQPKFAPALYVVRDVDSKIYLYGTVHVRPQGADWGGENAKSALAEAREVWTELDMGPGSEAESRVVVTELGVAPAGRPLSSWLDEPGRARLSALTARLGMPDDALEHLRPWLASITLSMTPILQAGYDPNSGVDRTIDALARAQGKQMRAFETARAQLGLFAGLTDEAQREMLMDAIAEAEAGPAQLAGLSAAWERGDLSIIEAMVVDDMRAAYPELFDVIFRQRNVAWAEALDVEMKGAGVDFVAVGAGHIVGDEGLVALMRARGYRVSRVTRLASPGE